MTDVDKFVAELRLQEKQRPLGEKQRCENCAYWEIRFYEKDDLNADGECHRRAPGAMHFGVTQIGNTIGAAAWAVEELANIEHDTKDTDYRFEGDHDHWACWPRTNRDDWCGDFVARKKTKPAT